MKIALIGPVYPYRGGIAHYTTMLDRALAAAGHERLLISFRRQYPSWLFPGRSDKDPSDRPLRPNEARYWIDSLNPVSWWRTFFRIRKQGADLIVLQWWTTFWAPVWITLLVLNRLFLRRPTLLICHNVLPHEPHLGDVWLTKLTLRLADRLVVQSVDELARLKRLAPHAVCTVVPHPVYDMFAQDAMDKLEARERLHLPADATVLLFFGIVRPYKGLLDLIEALPDVKRRLPNCRLVIAGEFWERKADYLALIERLNLRDAVQIDDRYVPNEEVALYFSAADALVAPYRLKTGSGVAQLAQGFGLPVIDVAVVPLDDQGHRCARAISDAIVAHFHGNQTEPDAQSTAEMNATPDDRPWLALVRAIEDAAQSGAQSP